MGGGRLRPWLGLLAALALAGAGPPGRKLAMVKRAPEDEAIFALRLEPVALGDTFPAYRSDGGYLIPLGEFCREVELGIQVDPPAGRADGFIILEGRTFHLDLGAGTVTVAGVTRPVDPAQVELHEDDIYVDTRLLAEWLPVDLKVDPRGLRIIATSREALPVEQGWRREHGVGSRTLEAATAYPRLEDPYRPLESPFVDATLQASAQPGAPGSPPPRLLGSALASGDLLYLSTRLFGSLDSQGPGQSYVNTGRWDPQGNLLGPLHATGFEAGQLLDPGLNLLTLSGSGQGAQITSLPLQRGASFDRHSFHGSLAPGWQVELYRDKSLLAFQASRGDGQYEFLDIPLTFGWNRFRLVFYGPQGQRREETVGFDVSESQTPKGVLQYQALGLRPKAGGRRSFLLARYGLHEQLEANATLARVELGGILHTYAGAGLEGYWQPASGSLSWARDDQGGAVAELGLRKRLGDWSLGWKRAELRDGFASESFSPLFGQVRNRTSLDLSGAVPDLARDWFLLDLAGSRDQMVSGGDLLRVSGRISTALGRTLLSNQVVWVRSRAVDAAITSATGKFLASRFTPAATFHAQATYHLTGGHRLEQVTLQGETERITPYVLRGTLIHIVDRNENSVQLNVSRTKGAFSLGSAVAYSSQSGWKLEVQFRMGLGREPRAGRLHTDAQGMAGTGALSAQAFLDSNENGVRDPGEAPVKGIDFILGGVRHPAVTDDQGVAFLDALAPNTAAPVTVRPASLPDPLMRPGWPGRTAVPRAGHVTRLDVPLVIHGEITGTTYLRTGSGTRPLGRVRVELVDDQGRVVKTVRSEFDGFYALGDLPPGAYLLKVPEPEARRLGAKVPAPRRIRMEAGGTTVDGLEVVLEAEPAPAGGP